MLIGVSAGFVIWEPQWQCSHPEQSEISWYTRGLTVNYPGMDSDGVVLTRLNSQQQGLPMQHAIKFFGYGIGVISQTTTQLLTPLNSVALVAETMMMQT